MTIYQRGETSVTLKENGMNKKDEALKMAIEALLYGTDHTNAVKACKEALEQPAQEPVAWEDKEDEWSEAIAASHPLQTKSFVEYEAAMKMVGNRKSKGALVDLVCYLLQHFNADTHPHQWQGLSDDEIDKIANLHLEYDMDLSKMDDFARAIEQALKEKNHG
jgi:hypothetical protein